ncbi:hypothetical protein Rsub_01608 [Raphidocelis subcapitata]|uniref:Uncharacterized protein n=1 Tax=Raphidocelis subcapitata TaxID=307507 RepID=A0A2V0NNC6_9CHLO|nr:hypothetical protein Rsub_01608 [Raphidocelis subcapitata]|eukprot:GBF88709.1 hypothetical protein Rsub_01608 [Raphidocelis subcapitata]
MNVGRACRADKSSPPGAARARRGRGAAGHGDFLVAVLKARPELLNDLKAKLWSRFFCLSVYVTMYLNDHQRTAFYESLGMNTKQAAERRPRWRDAMYASPGSHVV